MLKFRIDYTSGESIEVTARFSAALWAEERLAAQKQTPAERRMKFLSLIAYKTVRDQGLTDEKNFGAWIETLDNIIEVTPEDEEEAEAASFHDEP